MKKIIIVLLCCLVSTSVMAQSVKFGVKAGGNLSNMSHRPKSPMPQENHFIPGASFGGVINYNINEHWGIEADIMYSMQGCSEVVIYEQLHLGGYLAKEEKTFSTTRTHYIILPIAAKLNVFKGLFIEAGPQLGVLCNSPLIWFKHENRVDFGILGGLGYKINDHLFVNARYTHSFTETIKGTPGGRNRNIQVTMGYMF